MIVRLWRGQTPREHADAYQAHVAADVLPALSGIDGFRGGRMLRRDGSTATQFLVITDWASVDAVRAFAGDDPERAVIAPAARALLDEFDERAQHFTVVHEQPAARTP